MKPPENNDPLDMLLRQQAIYIKDDGFTAGVTAALPNRHRRTWLRPALLLGAAGIGSTAAFLWMPWKDLPFQDPSALLSPNSPALLTCALLGLIVGSLVWSSISAFACED